MHQRTLPALLLGVLIAGTACSDQTPSEPFERERAASLGTTDKIVIVGFATAPGAAEHALVESLGGRVVHQYKYIPFLVVTIPAAQETALRSAAGVTSVEDNIEAHPLGGRQVADWGIDKVQAQAAWAIGYRGQGTKVGIFDSGIDTDHPDLVVAGGIDLVGDGRGLDDCNGHGTHVAGIVGATNNGNHTVGVAPGTQLYSMRFADCGWKGGTIAKMIQAMEWAIDNGIDVVNMSFGFGIQGLVPSPTAFSAAADAVFNKAYERGVVLIAASGNSSTPYVSYPAAHPKVIAVGATDDDDNLATFSQYGEKQELTAPGVNNLASYMAGQGIDATLLVRSDNDRELDAIPLAFAGMTKKQGLTTAAVYAGLGTDADFAGVDCAGKTALVTRGGTSFAEKTFAAMKAGCSAIIIHNNQPGTFNGTLGTAAAPDGRPWIPGVSITLLDGVYLRDQIQSRATTTALFNIAGNLAILSGTSMASPHASGVAALILSRYPNWSPDQVRSRLRTSTDDLGTPGWDPVFGYGRVNALRAVQ